VSPSFSLMPQVPEASELNAMTREFLSLRPLLCETVLPGSFREKMSITFKTALKTLRFLYRVTQKDSYPYFIR
jgi:hypothetical protein